MSICPWCKTDSEEAAKLHEGPHATWCVHFREESGADEFNDAGAVQENQGTLVLESQVFLRGWLVGSRPDGEAADQEYHADNCPDFSGLLLGFLLRDLSVNFHIITSAQGREPFPNPFG